MRKGRLIMKTILAGLVLLAMVAGCGSGPVWVKKDFDNNQYQKDTYECELQRAQYQGPNPDLVMNISGWQFYRRCMEIRGYSLERR
jgi:hypothetical protein